MVYSIVASTSRFEREEVGSIPARPTMKMNKTLKSLLAIDEVRHE